MKYSKTIPILSIAQLHLFIDNPELTCMWIYLNIPLDVAQGRRTVLPEDIRSFLEEVTTKHYDTSVFASPGITSVSKPPLCRFSLTLFFFKIQNSIDVGIDRYFFHFCVYHGISCDTPEGQLLFRWDPWKLVTY